MSESLRSVWVYFTEAFGPLGPVYALAALAALMILIAAPFALRSKKDPFEKLAQRAPALRRGAPDERPEQLRYDRAGGNLERFAPFLEPQDQGELSEVRLKLLKAGYRSRGAVRVFYLARAGLSIGLILLVIAFFTLASDEIQPERILIFGGIAGLVGYLGPVWWVAKRKQERETNIQNGFPDALDMMLVCVEAGHSLDQAVTRVSKEVDDAHPALAEELRVVSSEMRAGKDRPTVLRDFAERSGVPDVSAFVTVLIQSAQFGTSIAQALRVYAAEMRDKRLMRAEEKANTLPTKLTLGTMFFTVPPLLLILVGPSLIEIVRTLSAFGQ